MSLRTVSHWEKGDGLRRSLEKTSSTQWRRKGIKYQRERGSLPLHQARAERTVLGELLKKKGCLWLCQIEKGVCMCGGRQFFLQSNSYHHQFRKGWQIFYLCSLSSIIITVDIKYFLSTQCVQCTILDVDRYRAKTMPPEAAKFTSLWVWRGRTLTEKCTGSTRQQGLGAKW